MSLIRATDPRPLPLPCLAGEDVHRAEAAQQMAVRRVRNPCQCPHVVCQAVHEVARLDRRLGAPPPSWAVVEAELERAGGLSPELHPLVLY